MATDEEINQMLETVIDAEFLKHSTQGEPCTTPNAESESQTMIYITDQIEFVIHEQTMKSPVIIHTTESNYEDQTMKQLDVVAIFVAEFVHQTMTQFIEAFVIEDFEIFFKDKDKANDSTPILSLG